MDMKKIFANIFLAGICIIALPACSGKGGKMSPLNDSQLFEKQNNKENAVNDTLIAESQKTEDSQVNSVKSNSSKDTVVLNKSKTEQQKNEQENKQSATTTTTNEVVAVPAIPAQLLKAVEYFRANNKFKDWDPKNPQKVYFKAIVEKDGTLTDLTIVKKCDEESLNKEAFRLIHDAGANGAKIDPGKDANGNPIRSKWMIVVDFPPK